MHCLYFKNNLGPGFVDCIRLIIVKHCCYALIANRPSSGYIVRAVSAQGGQQVFPDKVYLGLHIAYVGCGYYHRVFLWYHDDELSVGSIGAEGVVPASPYLVSVTLGSVAFLYLAVGREPYGWLGDVRLGGLVEPGFGQ